MAWCHYAASNILYETMLAQIYVIIRHHQTTMSYWNWGIYPLVLIGYIL